MNSKKDLTNAHLEHAIGLANSSHATQKDMLGNPYILHPLRVMAGVGIEAPNYVKIAAVLHDVVEDTNVTLNDIESCYGIDVRTIVAALTKNPYDEYLSYIKDIVTFGPPEARLIKRVDIMDNCMRPMPADKHHMRLRYWDALSIIDGFKHIGNDNRIDISKNAGTRDKKNEYERDCLDIQQAMQIKSQGV